MYKRTILIEEPLNIKVLFKEYLDKFCVLNSKGKVFYLRQFNDKVNFAGFNINAPDIYTIVSDSPVAGFKKSEIKRHLEIPMPKPNWNHTGETTMSISSHNDSPASIIPIKKHIFVNPKMAEYPICVANFIIGHEKGHQLYKSESLCDLHAINHVLKNGGNLYPCLYTLETVLKRSPQKMDRINDLIKNIKKSNYYG